jgi:hypothetical protein
MTSILIKKQAGGLRIFSLVRGGSEVKSLRTTAVNDNQIKQDKFYVWIIYSAG